MFDRSQTSTLDGTFAWSILINLTKQATTSCTIVSEFEAQQPLNRRWQKNFKLFDYFCQEIHFGQELQSESDLFDKIIVSTEEIVIRFVIYISVAFIFSESQHEIEHGMVC